MGLAVSLYQPDESRKAGGDCDWRSHHLKLNDVSFPVSCIGADDITTPHMGVVGLGTHSIGVGSHNAAQGLVSSCTSGVISNSTRSLLHLFYYGGINTCCLLQ